MAATRIILDELAAARLVLIPGLVSAACYQTFATGGPVFSRALRPARRRRRQRV